MEPVVHQHIDYFVSRIKELGSAPEGINIVDWTHWLAMDISADLSWNEQLNEMRDSMNFPVALRLSNTFRH